MLNEEVCKYEGGCPQPVLAKGLCKTHYHRLRETGSTELKPKAERAVVICATEDCAKESYAQGLCRGCYDKQRRRGTTAPAEPKQKGLCTFEEGCPDPEHASGLCQKHYRRMRKHGDAGVVLKKGRKPDSTDHRVLPAEKLVQRKLKRTELQQARTECPRGHEMSEQNGYWRSGPADAKYVDGRRWICRLCARNWQAKFHGRPAIPEDAPILPRSGDRTHCPKGHEYVESNIYWKKLPKDKRGRGCRICTRNNEIRRKYNLEPEDFELLWSTQGGACKCGRKFSDPLDGRKQDLPHVDHDHACCPGKTSCGKCVRGLLCQPCNHALGLLNDSEETIFILLAHMEEYRNLRLAGSTILENLRLGGGPSAL